MNKYFHWSAKFKYIAETMIYLNELGCMFWVFTSNIHYIILLDLVIFAEFALSSKFLTIAASNLFMKNILCPFICYYCQDMYKYLLRPNSSKFGMPSGHCQVYYAFMTYKLVHPLQNLNIVETMLMLWFGMFLCFQRVADNKHTWGQVIFGSIIGALSGYFIARH